jgi:hypothetical protein
LAEPIGKQVEGQVERLIQTLLVFAQVTSPLVDSHPTDLTEGHLAASHLAESQLVHQLNIKIVNSRIKNIYLIPGILPNS